MLQFGGMFACESNSAVEMTSLSPTQRCHYRRSVMQPLYIYSMYSYIHTADTVIKFSALGSKSERK